MAEVVTTKCLYCLFDIRDKRLRQNAFVHILIASCVHIVEVDEFKQILVAKRADGACRLRPRLKNGKFDVFDRQRKIIRQFAMRCIRIKNGDLCFVSISHVHLRFPQSRRCPCHVRRSRPSPR